MRKIILREGFSEKSLESLEHVLKILDDQISELTTQDRDTYNESNWFELQRLYKTHSCISSLQHAIDIQYNEPFPLAEDNDAEQDADDCSFLKEKFIAP